MQEFDLFVPLQYNDGTPVEPKKFQDLQQRLLDEFGGLTFFPQPNRGLWKMGDVVFQDEIVIYRVLTRRKRTARRFFAKLKETLKVVFEQEEILIVERWVKVR